jgi:hypothetical protein
MGGVFTIFGGYSNPGELNIKNLRSALEGTGIVGIRFETDFARVFGLEHTLGIMPDFAAPSVFESIENSSGLVYNSNLVLNLPMGRFVPYATVGLGLVHSGRIFLYEPGIGGPAVMQDFGTRFAVNYGGGVKFERLAGPMGVRFDVRGYSLPDTFQETLNMFEASGGLTFSFEIYTVSSKALRNRGPV